MLAGKWPNDAARISSGSPGCRDAEGASRMPNGRRTFMVSAMTFGPVQRALAASLLMFAYALAGASTNVASVEVRETLQGHFVYMKNCVFCHGKRGDGKGEMGLAVQPPPRDFGAGVFKYRSTPSGSL